MAQTSPDPCERPSTSRPTRRGLAPVEIRGIAAILAGSPRSAVRRRSLAARRTRDAATFGAFAIAIVGLLGDSPSLAEAPRAAVSPEYWRGRMEEVERRNGSFSVSGRLVTRSSGPAIEGSADERIKDIRLDYVGTKLRYEMTFRPGGTPGGHSFVVDDGSECFNVHQSPGRGYVLDRLEPRGSFISFQLRDVTPFAFFRNPFGYGTTLSASEILGSPSFAFKGGASRTIDGAEVEVIEFELAPGPDNDGLGLVGELRFSRRHGGELAGYRIEFKKHVQGKTMRMEAAFAYRGADELGPIPEGASLIVQEVPGDSIRTTTFEVTEFNRTSFEPAHFSLASFGLDDLARPPSATWRGTIPWWIAAGVAFLVLSLGLRRLARQGAAPA